MAENRQQAGNKDHTTQTAGQPNPANREDARNTGSEAGKTGGNEAGRHIAGAAKEDDRDHQDRNRKPN